MKDWIDRALKFKGIKTAEAQRILASTFSSNWDVDTNRSKLYRLMNGKQDVKSDDLFQIAEITGYPLPEDAVGTTDWHLSVEASIDAARKLGASGGDILKIVLAKIPVRLIAQEDESLIADFSSRHEGKVQEADTVFSRIPPR